MVYDKPIYIYPPRPQLYSKEDITKLFASGEYYCQLKLDDTRNLIIVCPNEIQMYNRHNEKHKAYSKPHQALIDALNLLKLDRTKYHVFDSLLLHSKNKLVKDTVVLMDILVHDSEYLLDSTYEDRYQTLFKICGKPTNMERHSGLALALEVRPLLWLAKNYEDGFEFLWKKWERVFISGQRIVEGLVFKKKKGKLGYHYSSDKCTWMGKTRYEKKGYKM